MLDKNRDTYASEMKEKTKELREQIDELANRSRDAGADVKKDARLAYHRLKDELNEIDKCEEKKKLFLMIADKLFSPFLLAIMTPNTLNPNINFFDR